MYTHEIKNEYLKFLNNQKYTHAITLKPNDIGYTKSIESMHRIFNKIHMLVQRQLLGSSYNRLHKISQHTPAFGIVEGDASSRHIHGAFKIPVGQFTDFEFLFDPVNPKNIWKSLVKSGTCEVKRIHDANGWHSYCLKEFKNKNDVDKMVFLPSLRN